jgi:uncharacterized protein YndB with AHSA1/START domain
MREFHGTATTQVPAPPDEVFAVITDVDRLSEWNRAIQSTIERPDAMTPGAEWVVVMHPPGIPSWRSRSQIEEIEPGARFAYRTNTDDKNPSYATWQWNLEPTDTGSRVSVSWDVYPKTFWRRLLAAPMRRRMLRRETAASLDTLRRTLETEPTRAR